MIRYFAGHPTAANLLMLAFIVAGVVIAPTLRRETFPRIDPNEVQARIAYPGASPAEVSDAVCQRIEDAVEAVDNMSETRCEAREGLAIATLEMTEGANFDRFFLDIKTEIDAIDSFPDEVETPVVKQLGLTDFVAAVAISGPERLPDLKAYAEAVKARMLRWGGIPNVAVTGFSDHQILIEVRDAVARALGLSVSDIAELVGRRNVELPAGDIETSDRVVAVRFDDQRASVDALKDLIVVEGGRGGQIRLGDIASIADRFQDDEVRIEFNGRPAALLEITKTWSEDSLDVIASLQAFLEAERGRAPPGVTLALTSDQSSIVRDRLTMLYENAAQGIVLVAAAIWLFFGVRTAFWISMGLPVSFLGGLAAMAVLGYSINMLTMVGLLIVIGIIMDDAIVIAENVEAKRHEGRPALQAAVEGTMQVLPGVVSSFITTAAVFGYLAFLSGDLGQLLSVVPVVMLLVLAVSLVEAFLILPNHLSHDHGPDRPGRVRRSAERWMEYVRDRVVGPTAERAVAHRYLTVGAAFALFLVAVSMLAGGVLKFQAFPDLDGDTLEARVTLPRGSRLADTEAMVARLVDAAGRVDKALTPEQPGGRPLIRHVLVTYNENADTNDTGANLATVSVDLLSSDVRSVDNDSIVDRWRREVGPLLDTVRVTYAEPTRGPAGKAIEFRLAGDDLAGLDAAAGELEGWLAGYRGTRDLLDDLDPGKPEIVLTLKEGAGQLGLDARTIAQQLRAAFFGTTADEIQVGVESYEIAVQLAGADRGSLAVLDDAVIATSDGKLVPLSEVANARRDRGYARIVRIDRRPTVTVQGDVDTRIANATEIVNETMKRFVPALQQRYPGLTVSIEGQVANGRTTGASMAKALALGLVGIFLVLSFQFRSYVEPIVVMSLIPFALIGAVFGHLALGIDFALPSLLGLISLAGIVVNDSILLVHFIKNEHAPGDVTVEQAGPKAAKARFRAILLTSLTTVAGLLPLLFETSLQAQILIPLVTSIAFGLTVTTLLVLFVVPAFYAILDDFGLTSLARDRKAAAGMAPAGR